MVEMQMATLSALEQLNKMQAHGPLQVAKTA